MVAGPQETTERKRPARCCAAVVRGLGCRGCQHGRGGTLPVRFRSQSRSACCFVRFAAAFPARRCKLGSTLPRGCRCRFAPALAGSAARASLAMPHLTKGRSPCPEGAAERRRGMVRRWAERRPPGRREAQGIPAAAGGAVREHQTERERGSAHRALPLVCFQKQTG